MSADGPNQLRPLPLRHWGMWLLAAAPALLTLWVTLPLRTVTPYADAWQMVE